MKGIIRRRFWWQLVEKISDDTNFVWTQLKVTECFKSQNRCLIKINYNKKRDKISQLNED